MDSLANIGGVLAQPGTGPVGPPVAQNLPQTVANLTLGPPVPPGSPSKTFPPLPPQQQQVTATGINFNPIMGTQIPGMLFIENADVEKNNEYHIQIYNFSVL